MLPPRPAAPAVLRRRCAALHAGACTLRAARLPRGYPAASLAPQFGQAAPDAPALLCSAPDAPSRRCAALTRAPAPCQLPRLPRGYPAASLAPQFGQAAPYHCGRKCPCTGAGVHATMRAAARLCGAITSGTTWRARASKWGKQGEFAYLKA